MRAIANTLGVSHVTVWRTRKLAPVAARIRFLRERFRQEAYDATPLVDKRNRVVLAASLATTLHDEGERKHWRDTVAVTKQGVEITGFDWRRTDQVRQLLDYIAKEVGDRTPATGQQTTVNVGISMDDAVTRVQALLSRMPGAIEGESTPIAPSEGGGEGQSGGVFG